MSIKKLALLMLLSITGSGFAEQISEIKVLNTDHELISTITDTSSIDEFYNEWQLLEESNAPPRSEWTFVIDIAGVVWSLAL